MENKLWSCLVYKTCKNCENYRSCPQMSCFVHTPQKTPPKNPLQTEMLKPENLNISSNKWLKSFGWLSKLVAINWVIIKCLYLNTNVKMFTLSIDLQLFQLLLKVLIQGIILKYWGNCLQHWSLTLLWQVIWRHSGQISISVPENVKMMEWVPQNDLLGV